MTDKFEKLCSLHEELTHNIFKSYMGQSLTNRLVATIRTEAYQKTREIVIKLNIYNLEELLNKIVDDVIDIYDRRFP